MGGLIVTQGHGDVWAWAAAGSYVWVHGPDTATVGVGVHGS